MPHTISPSSVLQDKFPDIVFHVSSITDVRKQEKGRFSIYFSKKHFEFMAHNKGELLMDMDSPFGSKCFCAVP